MLCVWHCVVPGWLPIRAVWCLPTRVYTPSGIYTSQQVSGSPAIQGYGSSKLCWVVVVLLVAVVYAREYDFLLVYILGSLGMLLAGYLVRYWELYGWREKLRSWEKQLEHWEGTLRKGFAEFKRLKVEKEEYERAVQSLLDKRVALKKEINNLYNEREVLKNELEYLQEEVDSLDEKILEAEKKGYQNGYSRVMNELRSLRIQKSAVLDLFKEIPELEDLLLRKKGMSLKRFLEVEKRRRLKHASDGKGVEDVPG